MKISSFTGEEVTEELNDETDYFLTKRYIIINMRLKIENCQLPDRVIDRRAENPIWIPTSGILAIISTDKYTDFALYYIIIKVQKFIHGLVKII